MKDVHFHQIKISGYRGRNFNLDMNPPGQHTVFVMDGGTGKTTTIELIRWAFRYPQSQAMNKFEHMWDIPAHILDNNKTGFQTCELIIRFSAINDENEEQHFKFSRIVRGEYIEGYSSVGDKIESITDVLEIDNGKKMIYEDDVHDYLNKHFRFNDCAEYFCFDGEKAREVMQLAANQSKIEILLTEINKRVTHPKLEEYKNQLIDLRNRILAKAKSKVTDKSLEINITKLNRAVSDRDSYNDKIRDIDSQININNLAKINLKRQLEEIHKVIDNARTENLIRRNQYEIKQNDLIEKIYSERNLVYKYSSDWILSDKDGELNEIKNIIKEKGNLPEPYREDLIKICLEEDYCIICGRALDATSRENVKLLGTQVASHNIHDFLSAQFSMGKKLFNPNASNELINDNINIFDDLNQKIKEIILSKKEEDLIKQRDDINKGIYKLEQNVIDLYSEKAKWKENLGAVQMEIEELQNKNEALIEYRFILDKIDVSKLKIQEAAEKIKTKALDIISEVISEGVTSILGPTFSAKLTSEKGLLLGENKVYNKEMGGMGGRIILSYCFAEAMTLIDPMIVDTPVGNIGSQRKKLGEHLAANHKQVVLLCLEPELTNFSDIFTNNPRYINNKEE